MCFVSKPIPIIAFQKTDSSIRKQDLIFTYLNQMIDFKHSIFALGLILFFTISCTQKSTNPTVHTNTPPPNKTKLGIEYLAHASFILHFDSTSLLLDPFADSVWLSYCFPKNIEATAIFSTHPHYDHDGGIFRNLKPYWEGQFPFYQDPGIYEVGDFKVTGIKGKHCDPYGKEFGQKNTIFVFDISGIRIVHWGDNGPLTDSMLTQLTDIDVLMLPIDDTYHILSAVETQEILQQLNPKLVIPMHYKIEELETTPGRPKNLGGISAYFKDRKNLKRPPSNIVYLGKSDIPKKLEYLIMPHSPKINK